jgi:hypothetical protein
MTLLVGSSASYVSANDAQVNFEFGYRRDDIRWKFKSSDLSPFRQRKVCFEDVDIFQIGINARTTVGCNFYLRGSADWGWILDGKFKEESELFTHITIPDDNTRTVVTTVSLPGTETAPLIAQRRARITREIDNKNLLDGRYVFDFDLAIGYPFYFCDCTAYVAPVIGYAFNEQNLRIDSDHNRFFTRETTTGGGTGPVTIESAEFCCDDKFVNRWFGPFLGLDFNYRPYECWGFYAQLEYHWARFKGRHCSEGGFGHDFGHEFEIRGKRGHGWLTKIGVDYDFQECGCWTVGLNVTWRHFVAHRRCHDRCFDFSSTDSTTDGPASSSDYIFSTNEHSPRHRDRTHHHWHSFGLNVTVGHQF